METINEIFPKKTEINQCIYCGSNGVPLQKEHIVPKSLGGSWVLHKASCKRCAIPTSKFEMFVGREQALIIRAISNLPTSDKSKRPKTLPLRIKRGDREETIDVPLEYYPIHLSLELYAEPAYLNRRPYHKGTHVSGVGAIGANPLKISNQYGIDSYTTKTTITGVNQALFLAKIAYGFAVYKHGANIFKDAHILPSVLGLKDDIGKWVGCTKRPLIVNTDLKATSKLHQIHLGVDKYKNICASIRLFANYNGPVFSVIVAPGLDNSLCTSLFLKLRKIRGYNT